MKFLSILSCLVTSSLAAAEIPVSPTFQSIGMFKNGLAVVRLTFPVDGPGQYLWDEIPRVTHGSFWIESDGIVSVQSTSRMVTEFDEVESASGILQSDLAGKQVKVWLSESRPGENPLLTGTVWKLPTPVTPKVWDLDFKAPRPPATSLSSTMEAETAATSPRTTSPPFKSPDPSSPPPAPSKNPSSSLTSKKPRPTADSSRSPTSPKASPGSPPTTSTSAPRTP